MAVYIVKRHMEGGSEHEHIASVLWQETTDSSKTGTNTTAEMVSWIQKEGGKAYVWDGSRAVDVLVVQATPPYLRSYADGKWSDNLLALDEF